MVVFNTEPLRIGLFIFQCSRQLIVDGGRVENRATEIGDSLFQVVGMKLVPFKGPSKMLDAARKFLENETKTTGEGEEGN